MRGLRCWPLAAVLTLIQVTPVLAVRHIVFGLERRVRHRVEVGGVVVLENAPIPPAGDLAFDGSVVSPTRISDGGGPSGVDPGDRLSGKPEILLGPNPTFGPLRITLRAAPAGDLFLSVHDMASGRRCAHLERRISPGESEIRLQMPGGLAAGIYLIRIRGSWGDESRKIVLLRDRSAALDP